MRSSTTFPSTTRIRGLDRLIRVTRHTLSAHRFGYSLIVVSLQSPPAVVRHLRADERSLRTATGAEFVAVARDRQLVIRTLARNAEESAAVATLAPGERDDIDVRRDLNRLSAASPPQV